MLNAWLSCLRTFSWLVESAGRGHKALLCRYSLTFFSGVFVHHPPSMRLSILDSLLSALLCPVLVPLHEDRAQEVVGVLSCVAACDLYLSTAVLQSGNLHCVIVRNTKHHLQLVNFHCIFFQVDQSTVQVVLSANSACDHLHWLMPSLLTEVRAAENWRRLINICLTYVWYEWKDLELHEHHKQFNHLGCGH
jgi:hypothetical protein